ncbi:MAG: hypothetical protein WCJ30_24640, partial [Deltaproteobacteria bacterium]
LVSEAAKQLGLPRIVGLTDFANATVAETAGALEELKRTGGTLRADDKRRQPPGVDVWFDTFAVELVETKRPARRTGGRSGKGSWQVFAPDEFRLDPATEASRPVSVHFEVSGEEHHWEGSGVASAVVSIDAVSGDTVTGRMRSCFADEHHSCVEGSFRAIECRPETEPDSPNAGNYRRREPVPQSPDGGAAP